MILSDRDLRRRLPEFGFVPEIEDDCIQPSSIDIKLFNVVDDLVEKYEFKVFSLYPGKFYLFSTLEKVYIPEDLAARVEGKSSLARLGLEVHRTAGYVDPGFRGHITLELSNVGPLVIRLEAGMKIAQLVFHQLTSPVERPYGHPDLNSHYQGQKNGPTASYLRSPSRERVSSSEDEGAQRRRKMPLGRMSSDQHNAPHP